MPLSVVAILAEIWHFLRQQLRRLGSVSLMAFKTVFFDRRMFPEERTAFVGMALVAEQIDAVSLDHAVGK